MKSPTDQTVTGPRELRDPRSHEYAIQTMQSLKRFLESKTFDAKHIAAELQIIIRHKHWEVCGHKNLDAYLQSEVGTTFRQLNARLAQDLAQDEQFKPAMTHTEAGKLGGRGKKANADSTGFSGGSTHATTLVARLKRDRPDIAAALAAGEFKSASAAARAAGWKVGQSPLQAMESAWKKASDYEKQQFIRRHELELGCSTVNAQHLADTLHEAAGGHAKEMTIKELFDR